MSFVNSSFKLLTFLLLTLQMARGQVHFNVCLHEDSFHVTAAQVGPGNDPQSIPGAPPKQPSFLHDCECIDVAVPGNESPMAVAGAVLLPPAVPTCSLQLDLPGSDKTYVCAAFPAEVCFWRDFAAFQRRSVQLLI